MSEKTKTMPKSRYWWAVLYPENMRKAWRAEIEELLQLPFAYCVHNADQDSKGAERKEHVHLLIAFPNTTTYNHALNVFDRLSEDGKSAVNTCQNVVGVRHAYDYLIHDTDACRKAGKKLYAAADRVCGNNFDIGAYEQLSAAEKEQLRLELADMISANDFTNYADFFECVRGNMSAEHVRVAIESSGFFERLTRGNYLRRHS